MASSTRYVCRGRCYEGAVVRYLNIKDFNLETAFSQHGHYPNVPYHTIASQVRTMPSVPKNGKSQRLGIVMFPKQFQLELLTLLSQLLVFLSQLLVFPAQREDLAVV